MPSISGAVSFWTELMELEILTEIAREGTATGWFQLCGLERSGTTEFN